MLGEVRTVYVVLGAVMPGKANLGQVRPSYVLLVQVREV
jgi:hypothetical protein